MKKNLIKHDGEHKCETHNCAMIFKKVSGDKGHYVCEACIAERLSKIKSLRRKSK